MRILATLAVTAALLLTGCSDQAGAGAASSAPSTADASPASPSATAATTSTASAPASTQPIGKGSLDDATLDKAFLAGARKAVPAGPDDATLVSLGRGMCADFAAGVSAQAAMDKVKAHGLTQNDAMMLLFTAKAVYCSTVK